MTPTNSELREEILHLMASWESDPNVDNAIDQLEALINKQVLEALRADRLANAEFWKGNIDKMFDQEISVYKTQLRTTK